MPIAKFDGSDSKDKRGPFLLDTAQDITNQSGITTRYARAPHLENLEVYVFLFELMTEIKNASTNFL